MKVGNLKKDQIQKIGLSIVGFIFLLYVYFTFFLGPLSRSRDNMLRTINDKQTKLANSKTEMSKAVTLEQQAKNATGRFAALKALNPEGAPIAWFPPRMKAFFANQQIDKANARLENTTGFKRAELITWAKYSWIIDLPQADYGTLGKAMAALENTEPLLAVTRINIRTLADQPQYQQVTLTAADYIQKK